MELTVVRYNTLMVMATTLSGLELPHVANVPSPAGIPNIAIYAIYSTKPISALTAPSKLILLNLDYYALNSKSYRPSKNVDVSEILQSKSLRVTRFTAAGADAVTGATFGGQNWENGGEVSGKKVYERATGEVVNVGDSEGYKRTVALQFAQLVV